MINLKKQELKLSISRLSSKQNFRKWEQGFIRYIGTLQLKHFLNYDIKGPVLLLDEPEDLDQEDLQSLQEKCTQSGGTLPAETAVTFPQDLRQHILAAHTVHYFPLEALRNVPKELYAILLDAAIVICDTAL